MSNGTQNTIRLSGATLEQLHQQLDEAELRQARDARRNHRRWPFHDPLIRIDTHQPSGSMTTCIYAGRDLSIGGMSVLHCAFVYDGTSVSVHLKKRSGAIEVIPAKVTRCLHMRGQLHEVGIRFAKTIELGEFVHIDPLKGQFRLDRVKPADLTGRMLYVDSEAIGVTVVRQLLKATNLEIITAPSAADAADKVKDRFDVIVLDERCADSTGVELCRRLREVGVLAPVVLISGDPQMTPMARKAGVSALVSKPLKLESLLAALGEVMLVRAAQPTEQQTLKFDQSILEHAPELLAELHKSAGELRHAITSGDVSQARHQSAQIGTIGQALGLTPVVAAVETAMKQLAATASTAEAAPALEHVARMCHQVQAKAA